MLLAGFFLHTLFSWSQYQRTLPFGEQLLHGVLKAGLIGFHTYDCARTFIFSSTHNHDKPCTCP
jgi:trehalose 6-phosphate synthase/phosphatase